MTTQPKVWSLWIYDRHCCLVYHADWSEFQLQTLKNAQKGAQTSSGSRDSALNSAGLAGGSSGGARFAKSNGLPLAEQGKLVYGLVFSLRNMTRKLSPYTSGESLGSSSLRDAGSDEETLHSFSTATYTLSHLQTTTKYTFVLITDPVAPPTRRPPPMSSTNSGSTGGSAATFSGGGGIPATGGMTTTGVLQQIARGPWVEFVARNAGCLSLERALPSDDEEEEEEQDREVMFGAGEKVAAEAASGTTIAITDAKEGTSAIANQTSRQERKRQARNEARQKELHRQRLRGMGKSIDSEAFRASVERVLSQNKLSVPRA